jgi:hypothetical protein
LMVLLKATTSLRERRACKAFKLWRFVTAEVRQQRQAKLKDEGRGESRQRELEFANQVRSLRCVCRSICTVDGC